MQTYDSISRTGTLVSDDGSETFEVDGDALDSGMFRFLRPGQRVTFDFVEQDGKRSIRNLRIGIA